MSKNMWRLYFFADECQLVEGELFEEAASEAVFHQVLDHELIEQAHPVAWAGLIAVHKMSEQIERWSHGEGTSTYLKSPLEKLLFLAFLAGRASMDAK